MSSTISMALLAGFPRKTGFLPKGRIDDKQTSDEMGGFPNFLDSPISSGEVRATKVGPYAIHKGYEYFKFRISAMK